MFISCFCGCFCSHSWFFYFYFIYLFIFNSRVVCASVNNFLGFYRFIFALVSSGRMGGKGFSIQFVDFTYLWIDSSIIFRPSKMLLAPIFINSSCNAKRTVGYPFQNVFLISRQKKSNVEDHCQRLCIYKCQRLKLMGNSHDYNIKSMSYSDELIEQVIFFLLSFRLFCFILFLQSTFFFFVNLFT